MNSPASAADAYRSHVLSLHRRHVNSGHAKLAALMNLQVESHSSGAYVFDQNGQGYLDAGGYGVFLIGHGHPTVVQAVVEQVKVNALSSRLLINPLQAEAAAALAAHCPKGLEYVYFCNSGSEATEAALKLACLNGCERTISTLGAYHGKTLGALGVMGQQKYRAPFSSVLGHVEFARHGDIGSLEELLRKDERKACVILEPVQAEAGVLIPPRGYLRDVRDVCDRYGALLVFDEIQSGMGRTGRWWACDAEGVTPDVLLVGKGLSGGCVPVGAMVASEAIFQPFNRNPLIHSSTFAGNPLAMAAVRATLLVMDEENIVAKSHDIGARLLRGIGDCIAKQRLDTRVALRATGLLIGLEFHDASDAARLVLAMLEGGVIVCHSLNDHRTVRLTPAAIMSDSDCEKLLSALSLALARALKQTVKDHHENS